MRSTASARNHSKKKRTSPARSLWPRRRLDLETLEARLAPAVALFTDKPDYAPGDVVLLTGQGFGAGETIKLQVLHTDGTANTGAAHEPWLVVDGGAGDLDGSADGNFRTTWLVTDASLGATLEATATGLI